MSLDRTLPRARVRAPRVPLKALLAVVAIAILAVGGYMWLRDSSFASGSIESSRWEE